ncbi:hypothetical protein H8E88_17840 [candidate division KSB1 bacterium]|nr:hypothetical protein [candidate division KSB1 bacterium]MBL7093984.1 hypothetical protein [candidate division KSB1 bacterium]
MNEIRKIKTDFLFSTPSFLGGAGSVFNIGGNYFHYNISRSGLQADLKALKSDWRIVGQDIRNAKREIKKQVTSEQ